MHQRRRPAVRNGAR